MPTRTSEKYKIKIRSTNLSRDPIRIDGWIPESFRESVESDWDQPFDDAGSRRVQEFAGALGIGLKPRALSRQVWVGSSPMNLSIPMVFIAETDALAEVVTPANNLMRLALPDEGALLGIKYVSTLQPPGPVAGSETDAYKAAGGEDIGDDNTISIGSFLTFRKVVITGVDVEWSMRLSRDGHPMRAEVELEFSSFGTMTKDQLSTTFNFRQPQ